MSYLDYDLGYESGYDTPQISTRRPSTRSAGFSPEGSQVSYAMSSGRVDGAGSRSTPFLERASDVYRQVRDQVLEVGSEVRPDLARAAGDLSQMEQSQGYEDLPESGHTDMDFSIEDAVTDRQRGAMDTVAGEEGVLAQMGFNSGERAMFREQYLGRSREDLMDMVGLQEGEDPTDRPGRIRQEMVRDYVDNLVPEVMSRYADGAITEGQARAIAAEAVRRQGDLSSYQAPAAGETPNVQNSTRRRIMADIRTIPQGSTSVDQPLYRDAVAQARQRFEAQSRDIFTGIDRRYYGNHRRGNQHASSDAQRFLFHRGIQDSPDEIQRLLSDPESLTTQLTQFSRQVRGSEAFAQEIDRRMPAERLEESRLTRDQRFRREERRESEEAQDRRERETFDRQTAVQDRQRLEDRADRLGMEAFRSELTMEQQREQAKNQLMSSIIGNSIQGLQQAMTQSLGQIQQMSMSFSQQLFQGTAQMLPRAADAGQWYANAAGHAGRAAS